MIDSNGKKTGVILTDKDCPKINLYSRNRNRKIFETITHLC